MNHGFIQMPKKLVRIYRTIARSSLTLDRIEADDARRIVDFLTGTVFAD